jgi:Berberine and berberine like
MNKSAFGDRLTRLTALKDKYDPESLFRLNANIPPSKQSSCRAGRLVLDVSAVLLAACSGTRAAERAASQSGEDGCQGPYPAPSGCDREAAVDRGTRTPFISE